MFEVFECNFLVPLYLFHFAKRFLDFGLARNEFFFACVEVLKSTNTQAQCGFVLLIFRTQKREAPDIAFYLTVKLVYLLVVAVQSFPELRRFFC